MWVGVGGCGWVGALPSCGTVECLLLGNIPIVGVYTRVGVGGRSQHTHMYIAICRGGVHVCR